VVVGRIPKFVMEAAHIQRFGWKVSNPAPKQVLHPAYLSVRQGETVVIVNPPVRGRQHFWAAALVSGRLQELGGMSSSHLTPAFDRVATLVHLLKAATSGL
jgi:hypothetical protein